MKGLNNQIRIIGGSWRGRRLIFPKLEGLRPTPDRVRETLFNWLSPSIQGSYCLDLFAGSGALGVEALSRGAAKVTFVEQHPIAIRQLRQNLIGLGVAPECAVQAEVLSWLKGQAKPFDVVFIDPPFGHNLLLPTCVGLEKECWLAPYASIYIEAEKDLNTLSLPKTWRIEREKIAGKVIYRLAVRYSSKHKVLMTY